MKYFLSNKRKTFAIVLVVILSVFCVYFVSALVESIFQTAEESNIESLSDFSIISTKGNEIDIDDKIWNMIEKDESVDCIYSSIVETTYINNIFGETSAFMIYVSEDDMSAIFDRCGFRLETGRMPKGNDYEVIMHKDMLKNKDLFVGDEIEISSGKYNIVGSYSGGSMLALGVKSHVVTQYEELGADISEVRFAGVIFPKSNIDDMNNMLDGIEDDKVDISTASYIRKEFDEQTRSVNLIMSLIIVIVITCISSAIGVVLSTLYSNRIDEFGILNAIGYSKKRIILKNIFLEIFCLIFISWLIGIIVSICALKMINENIFESMGQSMTIVNVQSLIYTFISLITILIISVFPIIIKLSKADLISVIERR